MPRAATVFFAIAAIAASPAITAQAAPATERISQHGRWFVDDQGRVLTIHGGNVLLPDYARNSDQWSTATPSRMAEQGFNGVRLVNAPQQALFPQTRLRSLQPAMPALLTSTVLDHFTKALANLP